MTELASRLASLLHEVAQSLVSDSGPSATSGCKRAGGVIAGQSDLTDSKIEALMPSLVQTARSLIDARKAREMFLPAELFGEPAWNILLDLFVSNAKGIRVPVTSACIASGVPTTTALRYIEILITLGLLDRSASEADRRVSYVEISTNGLHAMSAYLKTQHN